MLCRASPASGAVISLLDSQLAASCSGKKGWVPDPSLKSWRKQCLGAWRWERQGVFGKRQNIEVEFTWLKIRVKWRGDAWECLYFISSTPWVRYPWPCPPVSLPVCISYLVLHNKSVPKLNNLKDNDSLYILTLSVSAGQVLRSKFTLGLSWGCSQDVSQGYGHLKAWPGLEDYSQDASLPRGWLLAGGLSFPNGGVFLRVSDMREQNRSCRFVFFQCTGPRSHKQS